MTEADRPSRLPSEDSLLAAARGGDAESVAELLRIHHDAVARTLNGKIPRRWQALLGPEDILQQTYADVFVEIRTFIPCGPHAFISWVATLARHNLIDAIRMLEADKRGGGRMVIGSAEISREALLDRIQAGQSTPSVQASRREACDAMLDAIRRLPEDYRKVIESYDLQGDSIENVARTLNRSPGAAFLLRNRALRRLRAAMGTGSDFLTRQS